MWRATVLLLIAFSSRLQAQENCGFPVSLARSGFEAGEQAQFVTLPIDGTPLSINIVSPTEGQVIGVDRLQVFGSLTGPSNIGVVVNDELALANASQFSTRPIVLEAGAQTITVTLKNVDGGSVSATRNITVTPSLGADVQLIAATTGGYAPQTIPFKLITRFPAA
jgi:hypothetical protein